MEKAERVERIRIPRETPDCQDFADDTVPWEAGYDELPYQRSDLDAALARALWWRHFVVRRDGAPEDAIARIHITSEPQDITRSDREGWMKIGWVRDPAWLGGGLRVFWDPRNNRVQMDRPPPPGPPPPELVSPRDTHVVRIDVGARERITLRVRPERTASGRTIGGHHIQLTIPHPEADTYFLWAMTIARHGYHTITIPDDFNLMPPPYRRQWLIDVVYRLAERIEMGRR